MRLARLPAGVRRRVFGLATVLGVAPLGFFIPYRLAGRAEPAGYPGLEPVFRAAEPAMRGLLALIGEHGEALAALGGPPPAPRFEQGWFARLDAAAAYALIRARRPQRIIEIGSGHSTRFMARAATDAGLATTILCIDPEPRAPLAGLGVDHLPALLQDVDRHYFRALTAGDVLFVDSSHIAMPGTDVDCLFGDILPQLPKGVLLHIHDVFLPDPYPAAWAWRGYSEQLAVACLLQAGHELVWSSHWVATRRPEWLAGTVVEDLPLMPGTPETSVWLERG